MKNTLLAVAMAAALGFTGLTPLVRAAANDSTTFNMVKSAGAVSCLDPKALGRVTISDLGPVQNMHVEVFTFRQTRTSRCLLSILRMHLLRLRGTKAT